MKNKTIFITGLLKKIVFFILLLSLNLNIIFAYNSTPRTFVYEGVISDIGNNIVQYPINLRFSFWKTNLSVSGDISASGDINVSSANYSGYYEIQNITPNSNGEFLTYIGIVNPLPDLNGNIHKYYQVEYKKTTEPNTSYKIISTYGDPSTNRKALPSVSYALNADMIDNSEIGTGSGNIPLLGSGGKLSSDKIPNFINEQQFTINNSNQSGETKIIFGQQNNKAIKWTSSGFEIGDSLKVWGNLKITGSGSFNGRDVDTYFNKLDTVDTGATKYSEKVDFFATGYTATNVRDAILETKQMIDSVINTGSNINGPVFSWAVLPGTNSGFKEYGFDKNVGYTMPKNGRLTYISVNTDPSDTSANGDYVITKKDNGDYVSSKEMTRISMNITGSGDGPNSAYSTNLVSGNAGLTFNQGDIIRAYHVGSTDKYATLSLGVIYDNNVSTQYNLISYSILCDNESYLPNWGAGSSNITSITAQNYVNNSNGHCTFDNSGVKYQYYLGSTSYPGNNTGEASGWTTYGPSNTNGIAGTYINNIGNYGNILLREVYNSVNIPFTGVGGSNVSAEYYCGNDVINYDNLEILSGSNQDIIYCIAFNVRK